MGLPVEVDPVALSPVGEALMIGAGRRTYHLESNRLWFRYLDRMKKYRPEQFEVYARHVCGAPVPKELTRQETAKPIKRKEATEECPF